MRGILQTRLKTDVDLLVEGQYGVLGHARDSDCSLCQVRGRASASASASEGVILESKYLLKIIIIPSPPTPPLTLRDYTFTFLSHEFKSSNPKLCIQLCLT